MPDEGQGGFIYQGTTYVPIRFVSESLGQKVTWDGKSKSIYIGDVPEFTPLKDVKPTSVDEDNIISHPREIVISTGESFNQSYQFGGGHGGGAVQKGIVEYSPNGKYIGFETYLAPVEKLPAGAIGAGSLKIYADDELIYNSGEIKEKTKVKVSLESASKVEFEIVGRGLGILNPYFVQ